MKKILVIGGYGFFGSIITRRLAADPQIRVVITGRNVDKCRALAAELQKSPNLPLYHAMDTTHDLSAVLTAVAPDIVIHTSGPFQGQGYDVAEACLAQGCHYIDLADGRDFVAGIGRLDAQAREKNLLLVSGASSVPCLTAAVIDHYLPRFRRLEAVDYGITVAQRTRFGAATGAAVLSYAGKTFSALRNGAMMPVYGAQGLHAHNYPDLGLRFFGECDVPDHALFPLRYPQLKDLRFSAGQEIAALQLGIWSLSWLVRRGLVSDLAKYSAALLKMRQMLDIFGTGKSGFHMILSGEGAGGVPQRITFYMTAKTGQGQHIPTIPSLLLATGLARGTVNERGAMPCLGLITLRQYIAGLAGLDITTLETTSPA
ncbi:MAG TPA: saccharopine dehydrogenase NADP-binding domain-containing protein [Patescibacteria group bacterium]|nr:saccharopine dehydrogenase NADP-binding domain-containing protein [Patescibacteria group bacterium]